MAFLYNIIQMQPKFYKKQLKIGSLQPVAQYIMFYEKEEKMNHQFAENLKKIRKEKNISQEQLAEELGVSRQAISKWESAQAYPEMDKIITLCRKFNLNIDDLLHKDIKEVKGEEDTKKKLNYYIDAFLAVITDTINLFTSMTVKSKLKCLLEQVFIAIVLFIISNLLIGIFTTVFNNIFSFIPNNILFIIERILNSILMIACIILGIIIITHIFKIRYLDYYKNLKENSNSEKDIDHKEERDVSKKRINFQENSQKIIIRDPKNSEYKLIHGLWKIIIGITKIIMLWPSFLICMLLVGLFISLVLSFLVYKTGIFFIGLLITILSSSMIAIIFLLLMFNFIWKRKNNKKKMIIGFITSLILFGTGCGLISIGILNFDVLNINETMLKESTIEMDMTDHFFISNRTDIEYIVDNRDNIKLTYQTNKFCNVNNPHKNENETGIYLYTSCNQPTKIVKELIKNINHKKVIPISDEVINIKVYANEENIQKIKNNEIEAYNRQKSIEERFQTYENEINELNRKINTYEQRIYDLENGIK